MYKIEIFRYHSLEDSHESESVDEILSWYRENYRHSYENGECAFDVYKDDEIMSFDEEYELGFHN
jgi:hypothetical protein